MYLSDNEKRDIQKYIEAGKPLPAKFRFLLFLEKPKIKIFLNCLNGWIWFIIKLHFDDSL